MQLNISFEFTPSFFVFRFGAFELFAEWAPEGWLKVTRPGRGEMGLSLGRWAVLAVNRRRVASQGL